MAEEGQQIERVEEMRPRDADEHHHRDQRDDDADFIGQAEGALAAPSRGSAGVAGVVSLTGAVPLRM